MELFRQKLIFLDHWKGIGWAALQTILKHDPTLSSFHRFTVSELQQIGVSSLSLRINDLPFEATVQLLSQYERNRIYPITYIDEYYPDILKEMYQPPWVFYAQGNLQLLKNSKKIAVVGSRNATPYGKMSIEVLFPELIENGWIIVSGLAKGIDAISHECAMKLGGSTIGVIAGGFHHFYPKENIPLAEAIMETNNLIISEYPPDTKPERWHFPARNRIISGMSLGTLVIEAGRKSGSLITANYAVNEGREVFAVPGSIFSPHSFGTNDLIQQGAKLVKSAADIIEELSFLSINRP